jgi:hypothetical protein
VHRAGPLAPPQGAAFRKIPRPQEHPEGSDAVMTATIPLVAIAGFVVYLAYRYMGMRIWHAIICTIFGFLLGATSAAPQINQLLTTIVQWLSRP